MPALFVSLALYTCEKMEIGSVSGQRIVMRFCKWYPPDKIGKIIRKAQSFDWWRKNPIAAFLKGVKEINIEEKEEKDE